MMDIAKIAVSTARSKRRESRTSASAPAGKVKRNRGRLTATCTSETIIGLGVDARNQPPRRGVEHRGANVRDYTDAPYDFKAKWLKGSQCDGAASLGDEATVTERA